MSEVTPRKPYGFEPESVYIVLVLEHSRWVRHGIGKLTLKRAKHFLEVMEKADTCKMRKRLPNGVYFGACMASDHLAFIRAVVRYLEASRLT